MEFCKALACVNCVAAAMSGSKLKPVRLDILDSTQIYNNIDLYISVCISIYIHINSIHLICTCMHELVHVHGDVRSKNRI